MANSNNVPLVRIEDIDRLDLEEHVFDLQEGIDRLVELLVKARMWVEDPVLVTAIDEELRYTGFDHVEIAASEA